MTYCKKCVRILDEDLQFCPYCGEKDESKNETQIIDETIVEAFPPAEPADEKENDEIIFQESDINDRLGFIDSRIAANTKEERVFEGEVIDARPKPEERPTGCMYAGLIFLSVFFTVPGIVVGIIFMTRKSAAYRKLGLIMLIVSVSVSILGGVACCFFFTLFDATSSSLFW